MTFSDILNNMEQHKILFFLKYLFYNFVYSATLGTYDTKIFNRRQLSSFVKVAKQILQYKVWCCLLLSKNVQQFSMRN